jgi:ribonuclease-3
MHGLRLVAATMSKVDLAPLQERIGHTFKDLALLEQAVTHRSYLNENPSWPLGHNERLEFLGDAVLELIITERLYAQFPDTPEGEMTNWRAALVNATMLAAVAVDLELNSFLLLSRGEARDTGRARQYILANAVEALIGAIYLDGGYEPSKTFIEQSIFARLDEVLEKKLYKDAKSLLQEEAQERLGVTPSYDVLREWGPDHARQFSIGVRLEDEIIGQGEGSSKQEAQQLAAEDALKNKSWGGR